MCLSMFIVRSAENVLLTEQLSDVSARAIFRSAAVPEHRGALLAGASHDPGSILRGLGFRVWALGFQP